MNFNSLESIDLDTQKRMATPFIVLMFYIVVEYARPSFLALFRPGLIIQVILIFYLLESKEKVSLVLKERFFKYYLMLIGLMCLHVFMATNNYLAYMHLRMLLSYLIVAISVCIFICNVDQIRIFLGFFIIVMALCAIDRILGIGILGVLGQMGDENDFALAMNVAFPISFFLGRDVNKGKKWLYLSSTVLFVLANIVSKSRGGFLGLVAVVTICLVFSRHKIKAFLVLAVLAILAWSFASPDFKQEIAEISIESADTDTGKDRIELWKVGWRAFLDNPILGVGQGNMPIVMERYQYDAAGESYWKRVLWGRAIHSVYFTVLPELGLVGAILVFLMIKDLFKKYKEINLLSRSENLKQNRNIIVNINIGLFTSLCGFLVTGIFLSAFYYPEFWNLSTLIIATFLSVSKYSNIKQY